MARPIPVKECAQCAKLFMLRPAMDEPTPWTTHSIPITGPQGQSLRFIVYICNDCNAGKSPDELDEIAMRALLVQCAITPK